MGFNIMSNVGLNGGIIGVTNEPDQRPEIIHNIEATNPTFSLSYQAANCDVLVVSAGGSGCGAIGEGGGAGGVSFTPSHPFPGSPFPVSIGAGGSGVRPPAGPASGHGNDGSATTVGATSPVTVGFGGGGRRSAPASGGGNASGGPAGNPGGSPGPYRGGGGGAGSGGSGPPNGAGGNGTSCPPTFGSAPQPYFGPFGNTFAGGGVGGGQYASNNPFGFRPPGGGGHGAPNEGGGEGGAGAPATGSGGGGDGQFSGPGGAGGNGGGGKVLIKEPSAGFKASGIWPLSAQYTYKKENNWSS